MRVKYGVGDMEHLHHQLHMHTIIYVDCAYPLYATTVRVHTVIVKKVYLHTNCILLTLHIYRNIKYSYF